MSQDQHRHPKPYPVGNMPCYYSPDLSDFAMQVQEDYPGVYYEHDLRIYDSLGTF